jgi:hypothetical protein
MKTRFTGGLLVTIFAGSVLWAQQPAAGPPQSPLPAPSFWPESKANFPNVGGGWGGGWGGWGGSGAGSTVGGSYMTGMADMMRSSGARNLMNAQAAGLVQDAQRKYLENRIAGTDAYFQNRKMNREYRDAERGRRATQEDLARYAQARAPSRLSPSDVDPLTGGIEWPTILREDEYAQYRGKLESLFQERARAGYLTSSQRAEVQQAIAYLQNDMKQKVRNYAPQDYVQAKKFTEGLRYELYAAQS